MKTALILGTHSFIDGGSKVGMQHLAEGLARDGWQVDYVATSSSPIDVWGRQRHARLRRVWLRGQDRAGVPIEPGLKEYAFKALFPAHRLFLRAAWQLRTFVWLMPAWARTRTYDLCMHEASPNVMYFPHCNARLRIFRLADWPDGFAHELHPVLLQQFTRLMASPIYDEVWAVSRPLADYALSINPAGTVVTIPNGVEPMFDASAAGTARARRSAIFLGGLSAWVDVDLIHGAARLLPDWTFHIYGPGQAPASAVPANVHYHPAVSRTSVPALLAQHEVGLVPLKDSQGRLRFVERPLKFYEYISAGLGVASTDIGALRQGMGALAEYGNTAERYAAAIEAARANGSARTAAESQRFMQEHAWSAITRQAIRRIDALLAAKA
jgi:glycosyltransferase involved in cell wall biosynthesis